MLLLAHSVLACFILVVLMLIRLFSITFFKVDEALALVMDSAELWFPWIHLTSVISRRSYDWRKIITSIIRRFSFVVPSLTRQSQKDFEFVYRMSRKTDFSIFPNDAFITAPMSNPFAIPYNSAARTLCVTRLHFIEDQCMMLVLLVASAKQIT